MVLCQRKLGPVKKVDVEDETSMKNEFQESGRKVSWATLAFTA